MIPGPDRRKQEMPMTPQERQLVTELFDRLAQLENNPRDPEAEDLIAELWDRAPNASYALVQSVIVQDEALKRANGYIKELEAELGVEPEQPQQKGGFLDSMREKMFGRDEARGSVPSVRSGEQPMGAPDGYRGAGAQPDPRWNTGGTAQPGGAYPSGGGYQQAQGGSGGGSFLGTAASAAAGVVGGALLMQGIRGLFGDSGSAHAKAFDPGLSGGDQSSPWSGGSGGGGDLAADAGINDIGRSVGFSGDDTADLGDDDFDGGDFDAGDPA
jgi:hypothetical protein